MSRVLLDTHLLLWWLKADPRLPASLVTELQTDRHSVLISQASLWEMAIKVNLGRLSVDLSALEREVPAQHFQWLPISNEHLLEVAKLETIEGHRARLTGCWWPRAGLSHCCSSPAIALCKPMDPAFD